MMPIRETMLDWIGALRADAAGKFPEKVTAFREGMAVHGRYGQPCPRCGAKVQRIRYADNETNYCAVCQTGGKLLADRALAGCCARIGRERWRSWKACEDPCLVSQAGYFLFPPLECPPPECPPLECPPPQSGVDLLTAFISADRTKSRHIRSSLYPQSLK